MSVSPADGEDLARAIGELYQDAETALLQRVARAVAAGLDAPIWVEQKLWALGDLRQAVAEVIADLRRDASGALAAAVRTAYQRGDHSAVAELGALSPGRRAAAYRELPGARSADRLAAAAVAEQEPVYLRILRATIDAYRRITAQVSSSVLLGALTRQQAAQRALDQFAARGISGFTDSAGRNWDMASYAEMAARTVTGRAAVQGHTDRLTAIGVQLVIVSDAPLECPLCRPWEGKVLSLDGTGPQTLHLQHATDDTTTVTVHTAGSLAEARAAGLLHPNCRHSVSAYLPGLTSRPEAPPHPGGATYDDTQQQRYLERQVRFWKRRQAAALDDDAQKSAATKVRDYQARIRQLTAAKDLPRKPQREQIGRAR
jgi:hypothetical protein